MKIAYCTNIWNHHQGPVCRELAKLLGEDFKMVLFQPLDCQWSKERISQGWNLIPPDESWIAGPPRTESENERKLLHDYLESADVAIIGISPYMDRRIISKRIRSGKLTFIMGERYFKKPRRFVDYFNLHCWHRWFRLWRLLHPRNVHFLQQNYWCKDDLAFLHVCKGRTWQWGYLTDVPEAEPRQRTTAKLRIGWCGRMLDWKHVEYLLQAVSKVGAEVQKRIEVEIVGGGPEKVNLEQLSDSLGLCKCVRFLDFMKKDQVLEWMRGLDVYAFMSNREEGWGAALLESMGQGCVPIANEAAGSTLVAISDGVNGYVFKDGDVEAIGNRIIWMIKHREELRKVSIAAWEGARLLSPAQGAKRLIALVTALISGKVVPSEEGLCKKVR